jgi:DNA-binding NtrC family response regulator
MRRYLIVDDNVALAENLAEILAADGAAEATVAENGERALGLVRQQRFDALVTDMRMPVMSGAALVHHIRRADPGLPALVMTGYTSDHDLESARHEGLLAVLPKPVPMPRLLELLGRARRDGLVAIIEDDPSLADNLTEALSARGFAAVTASSILETERLGHLRPCCALVDMRIPGGHDGAAMISLAARFPALPMLVMTAHSEAAPPLPHRGLFHKPFDTAQLLAAVERLHAAARTDAT